MIEAALAAKFMAFDVENAELRDVFIVLLDVVLEMGLHYNCHGQDQHSFGVQKR